MLVGHWYDADHKTRPFGKYKLQLQPDGRYDILEINPTGAKSKLTTSDVSPGYVENEFLLKDPKQPEPKALNPATAKVRTWLFENIPKIGPGAWERAERFCREAPDEKILAMHEALRRAQILTSKALKAVDAYAASHRK